MCTVAAENQMAIIVGHETFDGRHGPAVRQGAQQFDQKRLKRGQMTDDVLDRPVADHAGRSPLLMRQPLHRLFHRAVSVVQYIVRVQINLLGN